MLTLLLGLMLTLRAVPGLAWTPPAAIEDKYLETIKVADDIYVFKPKIDWTHGNGVAIVGSDGVFFIDTYIQFNYAEEAIRRLKRVTHLPVRYVLNTHWHYDHVLGNGVFKRVYPHAQLLVQDSTAAWLERRVKARVSGDSQEVAGNIQQLRDEIAKGSTPRGTPITGPMKSLWEWQLREAQEYQQHYKQAEYVSPDMTFGDRLTMRWGKQTLQIIHMTDNGHSPGDVVVWIPEHRILVAGDIVVAPTPYATYYNSPGMVRALHALIAMDPAIIIPGHGEIQHDVTYMQLLERAFSEYRKGAEAALAGGLSLQQALDSVVYPEIDRRFTGDDPVKTWAYHAFFRRNLIRLTYMPPT